MILAAALALLTVQPPQPFPSVADRAAGLRRHDGFIPLYWDARRGELLLEITRWNEDLLYGAGLSGGAGLVEVSLDRGQLGDLGLVRFERVGPRVLLRQRQTIHRSGVQDEERTRVVEESFPSSVLASLPVVAEDQGAVLVDATAFVLKDTQIAAALKQALQGEFRQDVDRSALALERTGAFPRNTEIEALLTFTTDNPPRALASVVPDGRTMSLTVHHTFLSLPPTGFAAQRLDPRVGFIPQRHLDHAAPFTEPLERYLVSRWRLRKKDPGAAISEPVEPIVFHLDRGIPEPERTAIREAALWWNHAFEAAGFKDALVVRDLPAGATFLDARYSGIEWISRAERGWSVGDFQVDPRTGEILHAVARIDSHRRRTTSRMWWNMTPPADPRVCGAGDAPDLAFLGALGNEPDPGQARLVLQRLAYLSAHEVGHTLGLMHNWAATTFGWGSVMDYLAPKLQVKDGRFDLSDAYPKDVGAYDRLMIQWGYSEPDPRAQDALVRQGLSQGLVYPRESDPRWAEYDWGADPVAWLRTTQEVRRVILDRFGAEQLPAGTPIYDLTDRLSLAYLYHRFGIQAAQQHVGGQFQTNALAGDSQTPTEWVPATQQREALALLMTALAPENLDIPDRVLAVLPGPPSGTAESRERFASEAGDTFSLLSAARTLAELVVRPLLTPQRAARLTLAAGPDALTLDEVLRRLVTSSWGTPAETSPRRAALRRVAQRVVLDALLDLASRGEASAEVRAAAHGALVRLRVHLRGRISSDPAAEAHLRLAERDLRDYLEHPEARKPRPTVPAPPGRPIG